MLSSDLGLVLETHEGSLWPGSYIWQPVCINLFSSGKFLIYECEIILSMLFHRVPSKIKSLRLILLWKLLAMPKP